MPDNVVDKGPPQNIQVLRNFFTDTIKKVNDVNISVRQIFKNTIPSSTSTKTLEVAFMGEKILGHLEENDAFVLRSVLSNIECRNFINAIEKVGLSHWDVTGKKSLSIRDCKTIECELPELTDFIWKRIRSGFDGYEFNTEKMKGELHVSMQGMWKPVGLNPHVLISRYDEGGHFSPHIDGSCVVDINERSFYSAIIYLNTVQDGGETSFFDRETSQSEVMQQRELEPRLSEDLRIYTHDAVEGTMLIFDHNLLHEGVPVGTGSTKYIIRTDLMFERSPRIFESPNEKSALQMIEEARSLECTGKTDEALQILMKVRHVSSKVARMYCLD